MKISLSSKVDLGFALALIVLAIVTAVSFHNAAEYADQSGKAVLAGRMLKHLLAIDAAIHASETAERGYVITGQDGYIAEYERARQVAMRQLQTLDQMVAGEARQQRTIAALRTLLQHKFDFAQSVIDAQRRWDSEGAVEAIGSGVGRAEMARIDNLIGAFQAELEAALQDGNAAQASAAQRTAVTSGIAAALAGFLLTFAWYRLRRDLARRTRAEAHLRRLGSIVEASPNFVASAWSDGRLMYLNRAGRRMTGREDSNINLLTIADFHPPVELEFACQHAIPIAERDGIWMGESQLLTRDGAAIPVFQTIVTHRNRNGSIEWISTVMRDLTEPKRAEAALRDSEQRFAGILNLAADAIISVDPELKITLFNRGAEKIFKCSASEVLGTHVRGFLPECFVEAHSDRLRAASWQEGHSGRIQEIYARRCDGTEFPAEVSISGSESSGMRLLTLMLRDTSERKRVEAELLVAKEAAERASQAKSEFLANMSHEIRTPLNGIIGMTALLVDSTASPVDREGLQIIQQSVDGLLRVINDILDFSKIEAGRLELDATAFCLRDAIGETVRTIAIRAHEKDLELVCDIRPDTPEFLVGDSHRLGQVLLNLVGNAIKFTENGEIVITVQRSWQCNDNACLRFSVSDTGIGIPAAKQKVIFEAFSQADGSMTRRYGGTGLGLAIANRIVNAMGGQMWVESKEGQGSTFHFTALMKVSACASPSKAVEDKGLLRNLDVLVVDDNSTNRRILEEMLARWEMRPRTADGADSALKMLNQSPVGAPIVLLDVQMPGMDGFELAAHIRRMPRFAGSILMMLSSADQPAEAARCEELGIAGCLRKPVQPSDLRLAILKAIGRSTNAKAEAKQPDPSMRGVGTDATILVVDDNSVNRTVAMRVLQRSGYETVAACTGREAVVASEANDFDLILMDVQMPEMDGYEATAAIRSRENTGHSRTPIIAMTAHALEGDRERTLDAGMDDYLSKPVRPKELVSMVERWLDKARSGWVTPVRVAPAPEFLVHATRDPDLLRQLVDQSLSECDRQRRELRNAISRNDCRSIQTVAQQLKRTLLPFGAETAVHLASEMEAMAQHNRMHGAADLLNQFETEMDRLRPELVSLGIGCGSA